MPLFTRTRTNPIFYRDRIEALLSDEPQRLERMRTEPGSLDLLTWNIFASLDTHHDQAWLAYRLQALGGANLRAPVRMSLFSGAQRMPYLRPSAAYLDALHRRTGVDGDEQSSGVRAFEQPIEVPVRIETPDVLVLVDTGLERLRPGAGGRDRMAELVDTGLEHARRLSASLAIMVIANAGSALLETRIPALGEADAVARLLPWRRNIPPVTFHGLSWSRLLHLWREERRDLDLDGQPVRGFQTYAQQAAR
jgi:hypothetical protein